MDNIEISFNKFKLRSLTLSNDLSNYLSWMQNPKDNRFILSAKNNYKLGDLRHFILQCNKDKNTILLGIFDSEVNIHIGNIKFDNIDTITKSATMGILIGEKSYRGRGIARIVIMESSKWLLVNLGIRKIYLGVDTQNFYARKLYENIGFKYIKKQSSQHLTMCLSIDD